MGVQCCGEGEEGRLFPKRVGWVSSTTTVVELGVFPWAGYRVVLLVSSAVGESVEQPPPPPAPHTAAL